MDQQHEHIWEEGTPPKKRRWGVMTLGEKIISLVILVIFLFAFYVTLDANKYRAEVRVIEGEGKVGVNPTTESLDFGDLSRGTQAVRRVNLENGTVMPMYVLAWKFGKLSELMNVSKSSFRLAPKEKTQIDFTTYIPASAETGAQYTGRVYLFKIPTFWL